ncbi:potassium channel family protein [Microbacterium kyungheense]|uniref:Voltage-gated potassium channel n=1 Tax=Microbacterium kyungheense TaxID=1263636 RepID=A0A543EAE3_9MICO|nr:potassium channel family protein [Microbacterium kyungheense]TQM18550.1 voltage-gated potassium channel [Microbacterium kyungheense]
MNEQTWHRRTEVPLMIAGFAYLVAFSWRVIADLQGPPRVIADVVIAVTWAMFIADYLTRLFLAKQRWIWFRTHLFALVFALIPVLRLVRLLQVLTKLPGMKPTRGALLRTQIIVYGAGASVLLVFVASLAVLEAERESPEATITTFGIALWWSCVTVTTTGFGDYTPVTAAGRWVGVGLMLGGVALAGVITATLASWVVERGTRNNDADEPATRAQMRELMARIDQLTAARDGDVPSAGADGNRPSGGATAPDAADGPPERRP